MQIVTLLLIDDAGRLLLKKGRTPSASAKLSVADTGRVEIQWRQGVAPSSPEVWDLPGGHIRYGETPLEVIERELLKETGLQLVEVPVLFRHTFIVQGVDGSPHFTPVDKVDLYLFSNSRIVREIFAFCGHIDEPQKDLVLGRGEAFDCLMPTDVLNLELSMLPSYFVPLFLGSSEYHRIMDRFC